MIGAELLRRARSTARLSLRELARRAETSHSALAAYESARTSPIVDTVDRIVRAAGFAADASLERRVRVDDHGVARGDELAAVLELAEAFPARHDSTLQYPVFGRS